MNAPKKYIQPRIKMLDMEELMDLPSSLPDPGFGGKQTEFEEEKPVIQIKQKSVWDEEL